MNENEEKKPEQEVTHLEDISGTPTFYRDMAHMSQLMRAVLEAHADKPLVDSVSGAPIPVEMIRAALDRSQEMFSRQEHLLGKSPGGRVQNFLWELQERVNEAHELPEAILKRDIGEAIRIRRSLEPSVLQRAWVNELFVLADGVTRMLHIVRLALDREANATSSVSPSLPPEFREREIGDIERALEPARHGIVAHYFKKLGGRFTVHDYFRDTVSPDPTKNSSRDRRNNSPGASDPSSRPCSRIQPNVGLANTETPALTACVLQRFTTEIRIENVGSGLA